MRPAIRLASILAVAALAVGCAPLAAPPTATASPARATPLPATATAFPPTPVPSPSPPPSLPPSPTPLPTALRVANTGGVGANLRDAPGTGKVLIILADGAVVAVVGPDQQAGGKTWRNVRDGAGHTGWMAADFLSAGAADESDAPANGPASPTALPLVPITPSFVSVVGGRSGREASVTVQAAPGALCSIAYVTPAGTRSAAEGLVAKRANGGGRVAWVWMIGARENPGSGTVTVTCDGASASAEIVIG